MTTSFNPFSPPMVPAPQPPKTKSAGVVPVMPIKHICKHPPGSLMVAIKPTFPFFMVWRSRSICNCDLIALLRQAIEVAHAQPGTPVGVPLSKREQLNNDSVKRPGLIVSIIARNLLRIAHLKGKPGK